MTGATAAGVSRRNRSTISRADLQPENQIEHTTIEGVEAWRSTGLHPSFRVPGPLRPGWWRFEVAARRLDNQNAERVQADFRADFGAGVAPGPPLERVVWNAELNEKHIYIHLPRTVDALVFQPLSGPGVVRIEAFSARRLSRMGSLATAVHHKLRLLREYNCTGRVLGRGMKMLLTGRFGEVRRKLFKSLPDTRRYNPESDAYIRMIAGLGRCRVPLTRQERQCLVEECAELPARPIVSILLPVHEISAHTLLFEVESVLKQAYEQWELHIVLPREARQDEIKLAENYAERFESIHVAVVDGDIDEALADALDRVEGDYLLFLHPGFELGEQALLRLIQTLQREPVTDAVLNQVPPPKDQNGRTVLSGSAFRPGAAGRQVNLYRTADVRALPRLPAIDNSGLPIGTELVRRLPAQIEIAYFHEILSYPISCLTTLPGAPEEFVELGNPPRTILLTGNICGLSGWDNVVFEIARGLHSLGANIRLNAASAHQADLLPPFLLPARRLRRDGDLELLLAPPHLLAHHPHPAGCIIFTMWESDRLEPAWVKDLNEAAMVIVPSQWALESFRSSGVTTPIEIVPLGHDLLTFHPDGSWPSNCTFGTAAALWGGGVRKNTSRVIEAFTNAFRDELDVRLRVKITPNCRFEEPDDPRIEVLRQFLLPNELADWYRSLTAYVNASSAEGFGLHLVEAMACGRPVVSAAYSAVTEYFDATVGFPVTHCLVEAEGSIYRGRWADLDDGDLAAAMRRVYENDQLARECGERASVRMRRFTWKEAGRRLLQVLEARAGDRLTV